MHLENGLRNGGQFVQRELLLKDGLFAVPWTNMWMLQILLTCAIYCEPIAEQSNNA